VLSIDRMRYVKRRKLEVALFSASEIATMQVASRQNWIKLLKSHLLRHMSGPRSLEHELLNFEGLTVVVKTKTKHFYGDDFYLKDPERLVVIKRNPPKTFRPRWDVITCIEFRYWRPPSPELLARLTAP